MEKDKDGNYNIVIYDGNYHGKTHEYNDIKQAIQKALQRTDHFKCELGRPVLTGTNTIDHLSRMLSVDHENVCGYITGIKYNEEGVLITANFQPGGPRADAAVNMLNIPAPTTKFSIRGKGNENPAHHVPHFGYRGLGIPQPDGSLKMDRIICWDLVPE